MARNMGDISVPEHGSRSFFSVAEAGIAEPEAERQCFLVLGWRTIPTVNSKVNTGQFCAGSLQMTGPTTFSEKHWKIGETSMVHARRWQDDIVAFGVTSPKLLFFFLEISGVLGGRAGNL